jgi:hypothetical protein
MAAEGAVGGEDGQDEKCLGHIRLFATAAPLAATVKAAVLEADSAFDCFTRAAGMLQVRARAEVLASQLDRHVPCWEWHPWPRSADLWRGQN